MRAASVTRRTCLQALWGGALASRTLSAAAQRSPALVVDETWNDAGRRRDLPLRIRWPETDGSAAMPVVLFSHGLGGTREGGSVWGEAWSRAGFVVLHLQHPGSDLAAVRANARSFDDKAGLRAAAGAGQLLARLHDVVFVLDQIAQRHATRQDRWGGVRPHRVGLSGHSFGAHTTLGMAGQRYPGFGGISEPRLASFIAFSPTVPAIGDARRAFANLTRPILSITGTHDQDVVGNGATPDKRMAVFAALPKGDKAHLVLKDADHMSFSGQTGRSVEIVPREQVTRDLQDAHHALIAAITSDWWRATLLQDAQARGRLQAPAGLLSGDLWETA
ncbi:MAG: dienelactone hydrolase [Rhodoferax sp.]|nr:dienelactone hydrolase [Rhodoferax sp.]